MSSAKTKVALIVPSLGRGGLERVMTLIANYAAEKGLLVLVVCLANKDVAFRLHENVCVIAPKIPYMGGVRGKLRTFAFLLKTLHDEAPDACLSFSEAFNPVSILAAKISRCRIVVSDRSSPEKTFRWGVDVIRRLTYRFADGMISQTNYAREMAQEKKYNKNIRVIPNPLREIEDAYEKQFGKTVVTAGRLVSSKNFSHLIDLFLAADVNEEWELVILGDGPERGSLQQKIKDCNVEGRVRLEGAVMDVDFFFSKASIFAFSSRSEGFPNALHEAVAFPLAAISYDCPAGPADIIKDGFNGFLVTMYDEKSFVKYLKLMMESPGLRMKFTKDYTDYRKCYSADKVCEQYLSFVLGGLGNRSARF